MPRPHPDKMTFLEHLEELRQRLVRSALSLVVGFGLCWNFREQIFHIMTQPMREAGFKDSFIYTGPSEALMLYMKMAFFVGIFVASPYILWEIWGFISPGLYKHEKAYAAPFIGMGSLFFCLGAVFGHYYLFPLTFRFLSEFGGADMKFLPKIDEYYSFYSWFLLGLGLVFQVPVIITPTTDMVVQTALALPIIGLYFFGVGVAWLFGRKRRPSEDSLLREAEGSSSAP